MSDDTSSFGRRATRTLMRLVITLLVLALFGAVGFLLSERNSRAYFTQVRDGNVIVEKGEMLPSGSTPYHPSDPQLVDAYAAIPLDNASPGDLAERRFADRDELDRALFDLLDRLARPRVDSDDPETLQKGLYYVRRAEKLSGLSPEQRATMKNLLADVSFYIARTKLDDARKAVSEALSELKIAGDSANRHARAANQMLGIVEPSAKALEEALRNSVYNLSSSAEGVPASAPIPPPGMPIPPPAPKIEAPKVDAAKPTVAPSATKAAAPTAPGQGAPPPMR